MPPPVLIEPLIMVFLSYLTRLYPGILINESGTLALSQVSDKHNTFIGLSMSSCRNKSILWRIDLQFIWAIMNPFTSAKSLIVSGFKLLEIKNPNNFSSPNSYQDDKQHKPNTQCVLLGHYKNLIQSFVQARSNYSKVGRSVH